MKPSVHRLLAATCLTSGLCLWGTAWSQDTGAAPETRPVKAAEDTKPKPEAGTVTVTGKKKDHADRDVYDVTKNPDAKTGTAADALNKIPGVNVDPSGNVTLHGRNVVVYLNGRPSLMLSGDNRGVALKSMPSAYISTIEVISNPGSRYSSGDGAPIININTQRNMPPGMFGSVGVRYSTPAGGFDSLFLGVTKGKLSFTVFGSYFDNRMNTRYGSQTTAFDNAGAITQASSSDGEGRTAFHGPFLGVNLQYDAGPNDVLAAAVNYNRMPSVYTNVSRAVSTGTNGAVVNLFDQSGRGTFVNESEGFTANYTHYGQKPDETFKLDGSIARNTSQSDSRGTNTYLVSAIPANTGTRVQASDRHNDKSKANVSAEYNTPVGDDQLTAGGEVDVEDNTTDSHVFGPAADDASLTVNPLLTDDFRSHQVVSAVYATYQREITPRWTVLAGVRGESIHITSDDVTYGTRGKVDYVRLNPSLFATYVLSATQKLRFSYSHRQQRPEAADLNPHIVYASDSAVNAGNPELKPQENDAIEARYEFKGKTLNYDVRGFWRSDDRTIATVSRIIPDPQGLGNIVMQSTRVNWRRQTAEGVSGTISKQITKKLTVNADATVTSTEIRNPQISGVRTGTSADGSLSVNYTFPKGDRVFLMYKITGKSFTSQGYTTGAGQANLQYSHKLTSKIDLDLSANDLFRQTRTVTVIDTPLVRTRFTNTHQSPTFMIGLSRHFMRFGPPASSAH